MGKGNIDWKNVSIRLACGHTCGAFSWLLMSVGPAYGDSAILRQGYVRKMAEVSLEESSKQYSSGVSASNSLEFPLQFPLMTEVPVRPNAPLPPPNLLLAMVFITARENKLGQCINSQQTVSRLKKRVRTKGCNQLKINYYKEFSYFLLS